MFSSKQNLPLIFYINTMANQTAIEVLGERKGLKFLTEKFSVLTETPTLPDICGWLAEAEFTEEEIIPFRQFNSEKYTRHKVFRNEFVELLVIAWLPTQETLIHDHHGSHGVVRVFEGAITEIKYKFDDEKKVQINSTNEAGAGTLAGVGEPDIHKLGNNGNQNAISIHVYAPPLNGMNIYEVGKSGSWLFQSE